MEALRVIHDQCRFRRLRRSHKRVAPAGQTGTLRSSLRISWRSLKPRSNPPRSSTRLPAGRCSSPAFRL